jgi:3-hydroxyisobutyrate dehydrogenase
MSTDARTRADTVAVLGAGGTMGFPMARNLSRRGIEVRAWNRSQEKVQPLAEDGVTICETPAQAADGAGVVLTILADADVVLDLMEGDDGALAGSADRTVWLQMSTIGEAGTERCMELARQHGRAFVDAPVLGTKQPAEQAQLVIMASGPRELGDRLRPIFDALGQKTIWVGDAGAGTRLKVVTNSWVLTVVEGGAETLALAKGLGIDEQLFFDAIEGGPLDLPYLRMKGKAMTQRNFEPAFALRLAAKDAGLVVESAARRDLDLPLLATVKERLEQGVAEHGEKDMSATYLTSAPSQV